MLFPSKIKKGDLIGVTATSGGISKEKDNIQIDNAIKNLKEIGYNVLETKNVRMKENKFVSSSGEERAKEFFELYSNENVKYIVAASGGEFLMEMLPYLEKYDLKNKNPKWVQGFSDTSLLLYYLTTKYNFATVHSSNFGSYGLKEITPSAMNAIKILSEENKNVQMSSEFYEASPIRWQEGKEFELPVLDTPNVYKKLYENQSDKFSGTMLGGCVDVLRTIIGTNYDYTEKFCTEHSEGIIWCIENCEMSLPDFYRCLWQMKEAKWFDNANGVLIGRTMANTNANDLSYEDVLHYIFDDLNVPVVYDIDVGHTEPRWTIINGAEGEFEFFDGKGRLLQKCQQ